MTNLIGLEEQHHSQHSQTGLTMRDHSQNRKQNNRRSRHEEDIPRLNIEQQTCRSKSTGREDTLGDGVTVTGVCGGEMCNVLGVGDELRGYGYLGTDVAELGDGGEDQLLVCPDWLLLVTGERSRLLGLETHVGVGDWGSS